MIVSFTKMHGLGNDFVIIDLITQSARLQKSHIQGIADRRFGIGCDQVILITPPTRAEADFFYKIFNADGGEVEQCGNGVRCAAKFFRDSGLTDKNTMIADCLGGTANLTIEDNDQVSVDWRLDPPLITSKILDYPQLPNEIHSVSVGNPHGICIVEDLRNINLRSWGEILTKDPMFPNQANISFMQVRNRNLAEVRVYERGVGPTLACGSAACAATIIGKHLNLLDNTAIIKFEVGELLVTLSQENNCINMTGPANSVYIGRFKV